MEERRLHAHHLEVNERDAAAAQESQLRVGDGES